MRNRALALRLLCVAGALALEQAAPARQAPAGDPPAVARHAPARTAWGDPDFRGTWPIQNVRDARIPLERPAELGTRAELTDEEFAARLREAEQSDAAFSRELGGGGTLGLADWVRSAPTARSGSLLVEPADGRLPPLTARARELYADGRSTWRAPAATDWVSDLDAFERCITRGFPAVMMPQPYNNGIRVFQSPGYVVLQLETFGTRVVPVGGEGHWPAPVRAWHGDSRGRWEGDALVIETTNIVSGDSVAEEVAGRAAGPLPGRELATLPVGRLARVTERLTMTGPDTILYRMTYEDADVFAAPWTVAYEWTRDDGYGIFEYACHEGNTVRAAITSARALRAETSKAPGGPRE